MAVRKVSNLLYFGDFDRPNWCEDGKFVKFWQDGKVMYCEPAVKGEEGARKIKRGTVATGGKFRGLKDCELNCVDEGGRLRLWVKGGGVGINTVETAVSIAKLAGSLSDSELAVIERGMNKLRSNGAFLLSQGSDGGFNVKAAQECVAGLAASMLKDYLMYEEELNNTPKVGDFDKAPDADLLQKKLQAQISRLKIMQEKVRLGSLVSSELKFMIEKGSASEAGAVDSSKEDGYSRMTRVKVIDVPSDGESNAN